jgi:hypothetical protein
VQALQGRCEVGDRAGEVRADPGHAEKGVRITSAIPPGLAAACDPQDLDEMLGNLIVRIRVAPVSAALRARRRW